MISRHPEIVAADANVLLATMWLALCRRTRKPARERVDAVAARDARQLRHTATKIASKRSSGTGSPSSSSAATYSVRLAAIFDTFDAVIEQDFEILTDIVGIEIIAHSSRIRHLRRLVENYGDGRWRKLKGVATVRLQNGRVRRAELHWYEAHGIGRKDFKIKRYVE